MPYHRTQDEGNSALPDRQYRLLTTKAQIDKCVAAIAQSGEVHALDFETTGLRPESAEVRLTCICGPAGGFVIDHFVSGVPFGAIAGKLAKACAWAVFNAGFEGRWFDYETDGPDVVLYDVGVMSKAKLGGRPLRLAEQVKRDLGKERDNKDLQVSDWSADELTQEQYDYGFEDADDTYALWTLWKAALSAAQWNGFLVLNDAWRGTAEMEDTGMLIDAPYHETLIAMWTRRRAAAEIVLRRYTPESVIENLRSKKMLSDFLKTVLDETSVRAWPSTAKNSQLQTTRAQLRQASFRAPYPFSRWLAALMVFNRADKYLSTYGENLLTKQSLSPDGRVHGRFNIAQAITARYSSSSPNLQNIPRSPVVRRSFIAPDGTDMVLADYSGVELRVLAEVSDDPQLKQDVIFGDVHAESAITLFRQNRDEFLARLKAKDPAAKEMRSKAKAFSFQLCIAEGQLVLTDHGLVPIEQVDRSMQVWDGVEWVSHDGVIYKGIQEVIDHDGLTATPGHKVFCTDGTIRPFHHVALSQHGLRVTRTAVAHIPIRDVRVYTQHPDAHAQRAHDDVECLQCGKVQQKWLHNMLAGRGNACLCQRNRKHPYGCAVSQILMRRYTAAKERCKPRGANSKYYGQRGIEMRFKDSREYIDEILRVYPHLTAEELDYLQVDRIDNSGHYEPGNIRLVTLRENLLNRRAYTTSSTRGRAGDSQCRDS
jgi:hypothetical protein